MIKVKYVPGVSLDKSYFVASDESGKESVARATHVLPESLHAMAADETFKPQPEEYVAVFEKGCENLEEFEKVVANMHVDAPVVATAAKNDGAAPTVATEDVQTPKTEDSPTISMEGGLVEEAKGKGGDKKVAKYYGGLPGAKDTEPTMAIDVQSKLIALAEELKQEKEKSAELDGKLKGKEKEEELQEVLKLLRELKVDGKKVESLKAELSKQSEVVIGLIEDLLNAVNDSCEGKEKDAPKGPPAPPKPAGPPKPPGMPKLPEGLAPKASFEDDDLRASANIAAGTLERVYGDGVSRISASWMAVDEGKVR